MQEIASNRLARPAIAHRLASLHRQGAGMGVEAIGSTQSVHVTSCIS